MKCIFFYLPIDYEMSAGWHISRYWAHDNLAGKLQQPSSMKNKILTVLAGALAIGLGNLASAQTATTPALPPDLARALGPELQAIIATHRDAAKALLDQRNAALQALKNATPAQRDAIIAELRSLMQQHTADQKELAKAIRDAIKARRDQAKKG